jgi:hypothetical protein
MRVLLANDEQLMAMVNPREVVGFRCLDELESVVQC